ncbi:MAG TPA: hypothetical protein PKD45_03830 [Flavobacteriales bacterium]|nr:hypothetical protein [Flavobacteriales bacterium]
MIDHYDRMGNWRTIGAVLGIIAISGVSAQGRSGFAIKAQYDLSEEAYVEAITHPCSMSNTWPTALADEIGNTYGDGTAFVMESYIHMYQTTGDKAYLFKFVERAICIQEHRWDELGITPSWIYQVQGYDFDAPCWSKHIYQDGNIMAAFGHFVHLVQIEQPDLGTTPLPQFAGTPIASNSFGTWTTLGEFAEWLRVRTEQTLDWYVWSPGYWINDNYCFGTGPSPTVDETGHLNFQAGIGAALYYLGESAPNYWYLSMAAHIAGRYFSTIDDESDCYQLFGWHGHSSSQRNVIELDNGAYQWTHFGWRSESCAERHGSDPNDYEDISHAVTDFWLPRATHELGIPSGGPVYFSGTDMLRFRNTFTRNVYAGNDGDGCPQFHASVSGDDDIAYRPTYNGVGILNKSSLSWMWLQAFDDMGSPPNVYDIVMDYYACRIMPYSNGIQGSVEQYGLADVVAAQWQRECFDLTLFNRDVIYDQNFAAKRNLVIDPFAGPGSSFADPVIMEERFTVHPGVHVEMRAGSSIELKPGFHAAHGSEFHASIDPLGCGMQVKSMAAGGGVAEAMARREQEPVAEQPMDHKNKGGVRLVTVQDPTSSSLAIGVVVDAPEICSWWLFNSLGQLVGSASGVNLHSGWNVLPVELRDLPTGAYVLDLTGEDLNVRGPVFISR